MATVSMLLLFLFWMLFGQAFVVAEPGLNSLGMYAVVPLGLRYFSTAPAIPLIQIVFLAGCEFEVYKLLRRTPLKWPVRLLLTAMVWPFAIISSNMGVVYFLMTKFQS